MENKHADVLSQPNSLFFLSSTLTLSSSSFRVYVSEQLYERGGHVLALQISNSRVWRGSVVIEYKPFHSLHNR